MTVERKFANVFMASSASGNIRVIKFRDDDLPATVPGAQPAYMPTLQRFAQYEINPEQLDPRPNGRGLL